MGHSPLLPWKSSKGGITIYYLTSTPLLLPFFCYIVFPCLLQTIILLFHLNFFFPCFLGYIISHVCLQTTILSLFLTTFFPFFFFLLSLFPLYDVDNYFTSPSNNFLSLARNLVTPCFDREPKARVATMKDKKIQCENYSI
jgi:hypothetical protein